MDRLRILVVGAGLAGLALARAQRQAGLDPEVIDRGAAIAAVRRRFPASPVDYRVADLLDPPSEWAGAFDLVVESLTVQSLPRQLQAAAIARVRELVTPGGTLLVIAVKGTTETRPTAPGRSPGPRSSRSPPAT